MRKRPLHQSNGAHHILQQEPLHHSRSPATPSKPSVHGEVEKSSSSTPLHTLALLPSLPGSSPSSGSGSLNHSRQQYPQQRLLHPNGSISPLTTLLSNKKGGQSDRASRTPFFRYHPRLEYAVAKLQKWNDRAMQKWPRYKHLLNRARPHWYRARPHLRKVWRFLKVITLELLSIRCTCRQFLLLLCVICTYASGYVYFVKMPIWECDEEWRRWEEGMQNGVAGLVPPTLPPNSYDANLSHRWNSNAEQLEQFPYLKGKSSSVVGGASKYVVPVPDYELMGRVRGELAAQLRRRAVQSCQDYKRQRTQQHEQSLRHSLPVIGITVANDTPGNRYLRRLLHTLDLETVGSIVVTWYDEQTEAQIVGRQKMGLSHEVIAETLNEFIIRKRFAEIPWNEYSSSNNATAYRGSTQQRNLQLADAKSLKLMSSIATSVQQFCIFGHQTAAPSKRSCVNELLILRFSTNLGCSSGVNNPLFTHPTAPHWLITNYDIAYPPGVLDAMGKELQKSKRQRPDLAVHTYGYIYGRGRLENPWSNFVMTSCAVANVGVWDENIFPAYYEDDDYRDRIRYVSGEWNDVIGDPDVYGDAPQKFMNDTHVIRYQTDRNVSVAHGPLNASTYLSGTHETLHKVQDEEKKEIEKGLFESLWQWLIAKSKKPQSPFHYESHRWSIAKEVSDAEGFFRCKHGAIPDAGKHGEDPLRYFGWHERFLSPFVNMTRVTRLTEPVSQPGVYGKSLYPNDGTVNPSPWAAWNFNATRRRCVHEALNILVSMPLSKERTNLTQDFRVSCSVC